MIVLTKKGLCHFMEELGFKTGLKAWAAFEIIKRSDDGRLRYLLPIGCSLDELSLLNVIFTKHKIIFFFSEWGALFI